MTRNNIILTTALVVLCIVITFLPLMHVLLTRMLVKPLQNLTAHVDLLSTGTYGISLPSDQKSEIQGIADSFSDLSQKLLAREKEVEQKSNTLKQTNVSLKREMAERKLAETERKRLIEELEEKNAELVGFALTVSHDLKSPLETGLTPLLDGDCLANL